MRLRTTAALAATGLALLPLAAAAAPDASRLPPVPRCADASAVQRIGAWAAVRSPSFVLRPLGQGQDVGAYVVSPHDPRRVFATNGTSIMASVDDGCSWREVYALPDVPTDEDPLSVAGSRITKLVIPADDRGRDRVLAIAQEVTGAGRPHVLVSPDGTEDSFVRRDAGLPPVGTATDLEVAPSNTDRVWLSVRAQHIAPGPLPSLLGPATAQGVLYGSEDGGRTFTALLDPQDALYATAPVDDLVTDPIAANQLWAIGDGLLRHSNDGGRSFRASVPTPEEQQAQGWHVTAAVVDASGTRDRTVYAFSSASAQGGGPRLLTSIDAGETFTDSPAPPGQVDSAVLVHADNPMLAISLGGPRPAVLVRNGKRFSDITPAVTTTGFAVSTDGTPRATLHARASRALLRYVGPLVTPPPAVPLPIGQAIDDDGPPPLGKGRFTPLADVVELSVGESRTVPHVLGLPRRGTPLDLYVLMDTTLSMRDDLRATVADVTRLTRRLRAQGVDLRVGLGEFKGHESSVGYRRVLGVGDHQPEFEAALSTLVADGSGLEMQLIALDQAMHGRGEGPEAFTPAPCKATGTSPDRYVLDEKRTTPLITAGQQADFVDDHAKAVLMVTDTTFLRPPGTRLNPDCTVDVATTARDYADHGVAVMGVGIDDIDNPITAGDLTTMARTTGATQPGGRACSPELVTGRPPYASVCRTAVGLLASLLDLVERRSDPSPVTLRHVTPATHVSLPTLPAADLRHPRPVAVPLTYRCDEAGTTSGVVEAVLGSGAVVARLPWRLHCASVPLPRPAGLGPPLLGAPLVPAAVPPPAPPAQVVQPQVQPNLQGVPAEQQEEQTQLATALLGLGEPEPEKENVLAMVGREPEARAATYLATLTVLAGAGSLVLQRRLRTQQAAARSFATHR